MQSSDALRIGMNLGGAFTGCHVGAGQSIDITGTPGCIGIFAPGTSCQTTREGAIDVLEVYFDGHRLTDSVEGWADLPPLDCVDEVVRAAMAAILVAVSAGNEPRSREAASALRRAAIRCITATVQRRRSANEDGLRPSTRRTIERLISEAVFRPEACVRRVKDLAGEAGLSVNHFIRAFRQATGETPHQHFLARRRQWALALLRDPSLSVADVADTLGFSSPAHFVFSFRTRIGVTPGRYRDAVSSLCGAADPRPLAQHPSTGFSREAPGMTA